MLRIWLLSLLFVAPFASGQTIQTWSFDSEADIPTESEWTWKEDGDAITIDFETFSKGTGSLRIDCAEGYCGARYEIVVTDDLRGKAVTLTADIKSDYSDNDDPAYLWMRAESDTQPRLRQVENWYSGPKGQKDWDRYSISMPVPEEATKIGILVESGGQGTAWFDNLTLEETEWNLTDIVANEVEDRTRIWTSSWYGWLKVLMVYAFIPAMLLGFSVRSSSNESIHSVPWWLRYLGMACLVMAVVLVASGYYPTRLPLYRVFNAGTRTDQVIYTLVFAAIFTGLWYRWRDRVDEVQLWRNTTVTIRFFLVGVLLIYAVAKIYRSQFIGLTPSALDGRFGDRNSMRLLWHFFGHSYPYVLFAATGQIVGAILLLSRRTYQIGAIVLIVVVSNIVFVNYAYNIPVKFPSTILLIMLIFLTLEEVPRWLKALLNRAEALPPVVPYRPGLPFKFRAPLTVVVAMYFVWNAHTTIWVFVEETAKMSPWLPAVGVWTFDDREVSFPAGSTSGVVRWNRLIFDQPYNVKVKFDDELFAESDRNHFDSLGAFVLQFRDSTDQFVGRYAFDADTLRLDGIQFGDSLSLALVKRTFQLEPEIRYPMWRPRSQPKE